MARAQIIYTNPSDLSISGTGTIYIDMGTAGQAGSISTSSFAGADFSVDIADTGWIGVDANFGGIGGGNTVSSDGDGNLNKFSASALISSADSSGGTMRNAFNSAFGPWGDYSNTAAPGYVGVKFDAGSGPVYGWIQMKFSGGVATIYDFAYEASGGSISAGATASAVPEPSTYAMLAGLMALGATMVARRRAAGAARPGA